MAAAVASRRLRWGILGYARIARVSLMPAIQRSSNGVLHALASRDPAKLAEAAAQFAVPRTYTTYEELLRDPEVDAIYNPLPNSLHCEWTVRALEHGKHVLCEKPLGLDAAEVRAMLAAAEKSGRHLMEAFMYRYTARTRQVVEIVRSGELGDIRQIGSSFRFLLANPASIKLQPELGGGALYDVGCYPVNFIGLVLDTMAGAPGAGGGPVSVAAECVRRGGIDVNLAAVLRYENGVLAQLGCGFDAHNRIFSEIVGTRGVLEIPDTFFDPAGVLTLSAGEHRREIAVPASDRYRQEVEDFAAAILERRPPQLGLAESLRNAEVLDRVRAAAGATR